jgi:hypothetical protein
MSKLLENKQIIHIATEIVVMMGIIFYFSSKNKKLLEHIEDLSQRLEDQEDLIQKHEQIIRQLVQAVNNKKPQFDISQSSQVKPKQEKKKSTLSSRKRPVDMPIKPSLQSDNDEEIDTYKPIIQPDIKEVVVEEYSSDNESDLDADIADELNELKKEDGLKKRI